MAEFHFPIPGGAEGEKVMFFTRRHWASMLGVIVLAAILVLTPIGVLLLMGIFSPVTLTGDFYGVIVLSISVYYLIIGSYIFIEWLNYYYDFVVITEEDLINVNQNGPFNREIVELPLRQIQEVTGRIEGILGTIFSYGRIEIKTASEKELAVIPNVPNPYEVAQKLLNMCQACVRRRGY